MEIMAYQHGYANQGLSVALLKKTNKKNGLKKLDVHKV